MQRKKVPFSISSLGVRSPIGEILIRTTMVFLSFGPNGDR